MCVVGVDFCEEEWALGRCLSLGGWEMGLRDSDGLAAAWPGYRKALERQRAVDFDDQIHRALLVLLSQPEARRTAQRACRMMLVVSVPSTQL